ncbi:MAG: purine-nucleoside phosphorylase [Trueperaceae bacterium]|nr:purine-nucleoside phosphorylase [Trueperaceae bacterium]
MSQLHIRATADDLAPFVLLPGDPNRARFIAETFFDDPVCYNDYRQLLGYTGRYRGMPVSVQTTGMGCPSLAIVVEEIIRLGAKHLVRVGTAGIIDTTIQPADLVVATASVPRDGTTRMYLQGDPYAPAATFGLTRTLADTAAEQDKAVHVGLIQTEDAFYVTTPDDVATLAARGILAVEMEASALFTLGKLRRVDTGCMLVASNYIGDPQFVDPDVLQASVHKMVAATLEAGYRLHHT